MSYRLGIYIYLVIYVSFVFGEAMYSYVKHKNLYNTKDSLVNLFLGIFGVLIKLGIQGAWLFIWMYFYQYSLMKIPVAAWSWLLLYVLDEFVYYWFHRLSHQNRFLWAVHVNHHSSEKLNFSTAIRIPPLSHFIHFVFWIPLVFLGFHPIMIFTMENICVLFSFIQHTQVIKKLPVIDYVMNTPTHHRIHHASNPEYINTNYGHTLIIFDRIFGTFRKEQEDVEITYGITNNINTYNVFRVIFHGWQEIFRDTKKIR